MSKDQVLQRLRKELPYLREQYRVQRIALYGSFAQGRQTKRSDVDLLVELSEPLGLEFISLAYYLEDVLGRKVDLSTFETLHRSLEMPRYRRVATEIQRSLSYV